MNDFKPNNKKKRLNPLYYIEESEGNLKKKIEIDCM